MRPAGEVRQALREAARELAPAGRWTWVDMAHRARVGRSVARDTVRNMLRAGELAPAGTLRVPGVNRPMAAVTLAQPAQADGLRALSSVPWLSPALATR